MHLYISHAISLSLSLSSARYLYDNNCQFSLKNITHTGHKSHTHTYIHTYIYMRAYDTFQCMQQKHEERKKKAFACINVYIMTRLLSGWFASWLVDMSVSMYIWTFMCMWTYMMYVCMFMHKQNVTVMFLVPERAF